MEEDTSTNYSTIIISVLMAVVIIATVMIPIITATTQTTTTTEIDNEGAGWLKLGYSSGEDFDFEITNDNSNISIGGQTGTMGDNIFYADSKNVIFADSVQNAIFLIDTETSSVHKFSDTVSVENTEGTLNISDGTETVVSSESPTWAYIPDTAGEYGFFTDGSLNLEEGKPKVAVGFYAGVFAYNDTVVAPGNLGSLGLVKSGDYADGVVTWIVPDQNSTDENTEETPLNANYNSDSVLGLDGGNTISLRSADPTTGTQVGDLYYTFSGTNATIIGYSSSADWSAVNSLPDTVSYNGVTYSVVAIGENAFRDCTNLALTSLPAGVTSIGKTAFYNCPNLALTSLPAGVTSIGNSTFERCTNLALTSLPAGVTSIGNYSFQDCTNLALTSLPAGVTSIGSAAFKNCTNLVTITIPEAVTTVSNGVFSGCSGLENAVISCDATIGINLFGGCTNLSGLVLNGSPTLNNTSLASTGIKEVLNLGDTEITTTSYGLTADSVQDYVSALGYVAPVSIHETVIVEDTSLSATLLKLLPVFMVLAVVIFIGYAMYRPDSEFVRSLKSRF